ncbi:hypothetical protein DRF60_03625 [Chryseobacterium elymi]|uniref:Uncharacterized protein n=1 Tax=Chryseobacterium elymi TaxID=395936 RepID=A0A3D9DPZ0_9FLAO|nr:hypothetical protein [Chryseobacterium elymi]REC80082.1 hypothetical protein DRF60_03625 [Chryseobacterium elymi]
MIKNKFLILENMIPRCIMCKLGSLISLLLLLFYANVFASENSPLVNTTDPELISQEEKEPPTVPVIHINEGTVVYGMETISLYVQPIDAEDKEHIQQKVSTKITKRAVADKILKKVKTEQNIKLPEVNAQLTSHHSENSFKSSKRQFRVATLTNMLLKIAILSYTAYYQTVFSLNTNSLYTISFFLKGGLANSAFFTRPPPFA